MERGGKGKGVGGKEMGWEKGGKGSGRDRR